MFDRGLDSIYESLIRVLLLPRGNAQLAANRRLINIWVPTSFLMWSYFIVFAILVRHPFLMVTGLISCTIYTASIWLSHFKNGHQYIAILLCLCGYVFQTSAIIFNGGTESLISVWYAILPFVAAYIAGMKHFAFWSVVISFTYSVFSVLEHYSLLPDNVVKNVEHADLTKHLLIYGWYGLNVMATFGFIIERKRNEKEEGKRANEYAQLMRIVSHDIATPLSTLYMAIDSAAKKLEASGDLSLMTTVERINRSISAIESTIGSIKLLQQYLEDSIDFLETVDLDSLVQDISHIHKDRLNGKNIAIQIENPLHGTGTKVLGHHKMLISNVFPNLISNAIKFSTRGSTIKVCVSKDDSNGEVNITVIDHGVGMPEDVLKNAFNPVYYKKHRSGTEKETGTGWGLPIVHDIIKKMHGQIRIESREAGRLEGLEERGEISGTSVIIKFKKTNH